LRAIGVERSVAEIDAAVRAVWGDYFSEAATESFPATVEYDRQVQLELEGGLLRQLGLEPEPASVQAYMDALERWFQRPGVIRPFPEVGEVLSRLRALGYRRGIVSNWSWNLRERVAQVGLTDFFEIIWASAYAGCNKPHRGIFDQALARMQPPPTPDRVLYVGDSYRHDVVGARNAGLDPVLLDRAGTAGEVDCPVIRDLWGVFDRLAARG
jgi:putative hydrolase of the HAD superfamily